MSKSHHRPIAQIGPFQVTAERLPQSGDSQSLIINTLNPHSYVVALKDRDFQNALMGADVLVPDGIGVVLAARLLRQPRIQRITGYDLFMHFMCVANDQNRTVAFLGSTRPVLDSIKARVQSDFPNVHVVSLSPPYRNEFSKAESAEMTAFVRQHTPFLLCVGMTAPKQEKWVHANRHKLDADVIINIGAVFDFYAGTIRRPAQVWQSLGLEWFVRLIGEPRRLWRRSFISLPIFLAEVLKERLKIGRA